ncbi:hypothetical protein D9V96_012185 [Zobellia laminariae]|uniref:hypothetical protein n=1 Tax=Zobellia laminariae TaxID=248906 RepID=UPI0012D972C8|nr:hypothetical protein [Zobellia laminariae]
MQKRISIPLFFIGFFLISFAQAQVKIGDNPQVIDPSSILELESSDKVLVITRVDSLQMTTIVPNRGALVYNTTADCVYYYDGTAWISMCEGIDGSALTALPIENDESTIVITPTADGNNIEIAPNSISSDQILNGGINGVDIQDGSIGRGKLAPNAVDKARIAENAVGPYAIDRDSLPLSFFNNDIGFITGANIVSGDANNAIEIGSDGGALFDATTIETSIAANAAAIAADNDNSPTNEIQTLDLTGNRLSLSGATGFVDLPTADGSDTNINAGNNVTIQGNGTTATPYVINASEVDGSITNELTDIDFDLATNILSLSNGATAAGSSVNLSSLAGGGTTAQISSTASITVAGDGSAATPYELTAVGGGGGSTEVADGTTITGIGTAGNPFKIEPSTTAGQFLNTDASGNVVWANVPATGTTPILSEVLATGNGALNQQIKELLDPTAAQDAATKAYVDATVASGGTLTDGSILIGGTGDIAQQLVLSGDATMDNAGVLTIEDEVIESANILDGTIDLADLGDMGATANGEIIQWDITANAGAGGWTVADISGGHNGVAKSIFFADADGTPTTTNDNDNPNDDFGFFWDTDARPFGTTSTYGALYVGRQGDSPNPGNFAKMVISERIANNHPQAGLAFPLQIQNESGQDGGATAILFAVDRGGSHGKGSLAFERTGAWGVGDFHFLQEPTGNADIPTLADKSFSILSNKDIQLYGNVIAQNGPGAVGQVLTTDASGQTVWGTGGGSGTDEQNIEGSVLTDQLLTIGIENGTGQDVDLASFATEVELAAAIAASAALDGDTDDQNEIELPTGGASGNVLSTDGAGVYSWIAASGGLAAVTTSTSFTGDGTTGSELDIVDDAITTDELAIDAVIEENILDEAVTSAKIANATIALEDLSNMGATTTGQVLKWDQVAAQWTIGTDDGGSTAYTPGAGLALSATNEFSVNDLVGDVTGPTTATVIADDAITNAKIADDAVNTDEIAAGAVVFNSIANDAVNTLKIANDAVTIDKIKESTIDGQILTTSGTDVVWADAQNFAESNLTQTADRIYDLDGNNLSFDTGGGNIGIGALPGAPQDQLDVNGSIRSRGGFNATEGSAGAPGYGFYTNGDTDTGMFRASENNLGFSTGGIEVLRIDNTQNVGIGTDTPARKLHVAGDILADGVFRSNTNTIQIPDYVFQKYYLGNSKLKESYNFSNLSEVEAFIKKNHHLPGVTSAIKAKEEGHWNLSNSNLQNLEKIEELFLHTIEQEKEINRLKAEKEAMANELKTMKNDIEEIKALLNK